jgi:hypothetical protein
MRPRYQSRKDPLQAKIDEVNGVNDLAEDVTNLEDFELKAHPKP